MSNRFFDSYMLVGVIFRIVLVKHFADVGKRASQPLGRFDLDSEMDFVFV